MSKIAIKKGVNPLETEHHAILRSGGIGVQAHYRVIDVTGVETNIPGEGVTVYLQLNRKIGYIVDNFISLPLETFARLFEPTGEGDRFWEEKKSKAK